MTDGALSGHETKPELPKPAVDHPKQELIDGLTRAQCLAAYEQRMHRADLGTAGAQWMTPSQVTAAREMWSAALRAKVQASKERKRNLVTYSELDADE